jgi:hypothetical protein
MKSSELELIVSHYIANKRSRAEAERRWFIIQLTLEDESLRQLRQNSKGQEVRPSASDTGVGPANERGSTPQIPRSSSISEDVRRIAADSFRIDSKRPASPSIEETLGTA